MKILVVLFSVTLMLVVSSPGLACGDSLYRVGQGISYREYSAPLPGNVLIYARSSASAGDLAAALSRSGHHVRFVGDELTLSLELRTGDYDVVIAPYSEHTAVEASTADTGVTFLPIALSKAESETAEASYPNVMMADRDELKHYLKAIHLVLEDKLS
jgi:hypothetical protein